MGIGKGLWLGVVVKAPLVQGRRNPWSLVENLIFLVNGIIRGPPPNQWTLCCILGGTGTVHLYLYHIYVRPELDTPPYDWLKATGTWFF